MKRIQKGNLSIFRFNNLASLQDIDHFVSSRAGGHSKGAFESLNTGFHTGDNNWLVLQNRKKLAEALGVSLDQFTLGSQTHSRNIAIVENRQKGMGGAESTTAIPNTDALITHTPGIYIIVQVADCVPVLLYDPVQKVAAAIHAGWKGTLRRIADKVIHKMQDIYGCKPSDILAGIGPSNGPCCYEVGSDVKTEAEKCLDNTRQIILESKNPGKYIFDQWQANLQQLISCGIPESNIETSGICSQCSATEFFSSRHGKGITGRFAAGIIIK